VSGRAEGGGVEPQWLMKPPHRFDRSGPVPTGNALQTIDLPSEMVPRCVWCNDSVGERNFAYIPNREFPNRRVFVLACISE